MNVYTFGRLLYELYGPGMPDIQHIQKLGLLAVKIGQVYALRPDFLSAEKCATLTALYRGATQSSLFDPQATLSHYAPALKASLAAFEEQPFASASVGQVHRAMLKTGEAVIVKIIKGMNAASFRRDVHRVRRLFRIASLFYPKLTGVANPAELLTQIEHMTLAELDLRNEAAGYRTLAKIRDEGTKKFDLSMIRFPKVYEQYTTEQVLVAEYLPYPTMDELLIKGTLSYQTLISFFRAHGYGMYAAGIFHGDIHPGNIMVAPDGGFYFLDAGYIGTASDHLRLGLARFFDALCRYDFVRAAAGLHAMSDVRLSDDAYVRYEKGFLKLYDGFADKTARDMSLTRKMMETIRHGVLSGMQFSSGIFDIIKSHMYLDGMVLRVNPEAKLLADMVPAIDELKSLLGI